MKPHQQEQLMREQGFITVAEAADAMRAAPSTIYRAIKRHKIEATQVGSRWYVQRESFEKYAGPFVRLLEQEGQ